MSVDGLAAARTLLGYRNIRPGLCLHYVWQAYKAHGATAQGSYGTALAAWEATPGKHPNDRFPPAGVPVWFGAKPGSSAGDVVISLGNGRVACTDYPAWGSTGECTIDQRQRQIARPYLGWTETILGAPIAISSPAYAGGLENDMLPDERAALLEIRDYLGARNGQGTESAFTVGGRVTDIQLALTNALPVLLGAATRPGTDLAALTAAVVAAIPDDIAQDVIDALAQRLRG